MTGTHVDRAVLVTTGTNDLAINADGSLNVSVAAGEAHIGEVAGRINKVSVTIAGHSGTGAYIPGDVVGALTEMPLLARINAGQVYITELRIATNKKSVTPRFKVHFFNAADPTVAADDAPYKELFADEAKRLGFVEMPAMTTAIDTTNSDMSRAIARSGSAGSDGNPVLPKPIVCAANTRSVWILLETMDALAPITLESYTITLLVEVY